MNHPEPAAVSADGAASLDLEAIRSLIYRSCIAMDEEHFDKYLALCTPDFKYCITTYSNELRRNMNWLDVDRSAIKALFEMIPLHVRLEGRLKRHAVVYVVEPVPGRESDAKVTTSLMVFHTAADGTSQIYAVGQYLDIIDVSGKSPLLRLREVRLDTRNLGPGSHTPL